MYSLFKIKFNWPAFIMLAIIMRLMFQELSWYSYFAVVISVYQFWLLFNSIGSVIPVRYLLGSFMCLQMYLGPMFAYNGLDSYQVGFYKMQIPEAEYFSYALPAVLFFIAGLHINAGKLNGERVDVEKIQVFVQQNKMLPNFFIILGLITSVMSRFVGSELGFVFYLLGSFKYVGLFMVILGYKSIKPIPLIIVLGSIISSSLGEGMFADLLTWILFIGSVYALKIKPNQQIKVLTAIVFIFLVVTIQQLKGDYRAATWQQGEEGGIQTFSNVYDKNQSEDNSIFSFDNLAPSNIRINQGYIITNIMNTVPSKVPYANGEELYVLLEAAFLPRILAPNKLNAGDRTIFMKYSGMPLARGTSMGLSSLGDAYINFGATGGCIFMFFLGFCYSEVLNRFQKVGKYYPILLLFPALVFYYPIRPDCELQTILGHLVKACFLIYAMLYVWKYHFRIKRTRMMQSKPGGIRTDPRFERR